MGWGLEKMTSRGVVVTTRWSNKRLNGKLWILIYDVDIVVIFVNLIHI